VAHFDVLDAEVASEGLRSVDETLRRLGIVGGRAAVDRERERRQRVAEEPALHLRERQDADEVGTTLGDEVVSAVTELVLEDLAPADAVEERRRRATLDERFPARSILHPVLAHERSPAGVVDIAIASASRPRSVEEHCVRAIPVEVLQQPREARPCPVEVHVVPEPGLHRNAVHRAARDRFPTVEIEHHGTAVDRIDPRHRPARHPVGSRRK